MLFLRFRFVLATVFTVFVMSLAASAQTAATETKTPVKADEKKQPKAQSKDAVKIVTAEQVVESSILVYAFPGGRERLNQIRKTAIERGKTTLTGSDGKVDQANYQRYTMRGETMSKERIRLDQEFPTARYALIFNDEKVFGIYNNAVFTPRDDATRAFQNQTVFNIDSFLRYKENGASIALAGRDKMMGVDFYLIDVTDKQSRKMRFYVSSKTFRVMSLEYEDAGIKYKRRFYNYNYAQGTLVPYRTVLYANDKLVEETEIGTVTYGQKIDEGLFSAG